MSASDELIQQVHDDWKEKGFPYYPTDDDWRNQIFEQLINFKRDTLVDRRTKVIGQSATRIKVLHGLLWNTHGEFNVVKCTHLWIYGMMKNI